MEVTFEQLENERKEMLDHAAAMYNAYCEYTDYKSVVTGDDLPKWDDLRHDVKEAWIAAAHGSVSFMIRNIIDEFSQ